LIINTNFYNKWLICAIGCTDNKPQDIIIIKDYNIIETISFGLSEFIHLILSIYIFFIVIKKFFRYFFGVHARGTDYYYTTPLPPSVDELEHDKRGSGRGLAVVAGEGAGGSARGGGSFCISAEGDVRGGGARDSRCSEQIENRLVF